MSVHATEASSKPGKLPKPLHVAITGVIAAAMMLASGAGAAAHPAPGLPAPSVDPFYTYDGSLTGVLPGTVLDTRDVPFGSADLSLPVTSTQVLYRTTDQQDRPAVTVATVLRPLQPGPAKLVSYHTAYDGLGSECDPSYTLTGAGTPDRTAQIEQGVITGYLAAGYTVVVPDYEGEDLAWTIGRQSGRAALDGIRAAEAILNLPPSTPVGLVGYSGGSVPTQWGAEIAPQYAPELNIVGAAAGGLPVDPAHNLGYVSGSADWSGVIPALVVSYERAYDLDVNAFLSERGRQIVDQVEYQCIGVFADHYPGLTDADMVAPPRTSLLEVPAVVDAIADNIMSTSGTPVVPMLLAVGDSDGRGDSVMLTGDVEALAHVYCGRGVDVTYAEYVGFDHGEAFVPFQAQAAQFFGDRFAGVPPGDTCALIGPGNPLTPAPLG